MFNMTTSHIEIYKPQSQRPSDEKFVAWHNLANEEFVSEGQTIESAGFKHRDLIVYVYMGFLQES